MRTWAAMLILVVATLVAGCGSSSHGESVGSAANEPIPSSRGLASNTDERKAGSAAAYARLQAEARHWDRIAAQAESTARADLAGSHYASSESAAVTLGRATREIERIAGEMEDNAAGLKSATGHQEALRAQISRENRQTERELAELESEP